jgi:hypothetical protein
MVNRQAEGFEQDYLEFPDAASTACKGTMGVRGWRRKGTMAQVRYCPTKR